MLAEYCSVYGEFCRTAHADLYIPVDRHFTPKEILMTQAVIDTSRATLVPLQCVIEFLREGARVLEGCKTHPSETTIIGLTSDQVQALELVLARTNRKQRDFIEGDLATAAEAESSSRRSALTRLAPFINKAKNDLLSAEELMSALNAEADPRIARERFLSLEGNSVTVRDDREILLLPNSKPLPKKYAAQDLYSLNVRVENTDVTSSEARLLLIDSYLPSPLFSRTDVGLRSVTTRIPDADDLRRIGLCMTFGVPVSLELAITVGVGHSGLAYSATLIRLTNSEAIGNQLKKAMTAQSLNLF